MGPKQRFTSLDVSCMTRDVALRAVGLRLTNIYDLEGSKLYLMKFSIPESERAADKGESKVNVLIESGVRFHSTGYDRDKNDMPSAFTMKLRKHLRSKRLESVSQLGADRIVDFRFGTGETAFHLIVELYSHGNVVLASHDYNVLALLRTHQFDEDVALKVGEPYPVSYTTKGTSGGGDDDGEALSGVLTMDSDALIEYTKMKEQEHIDWHKGPANEKSKRKLKKQYLKQLFLAKDSGVSHYSGEIIEHCILTSGFKFSSSIDELYTAPKEQLDSLIQSLHKGAEMMKAALESGSLPGYIIKGRNDGSYVDFTPLVMEQHRGKEGGDDAGELITEYATFGEAVDEYFARSESQKMEKALHAAEQSAAAKVNKVREARESHIDSLVARQESMEVSARLAEYFAEDIDKVSMVINSCLENGMDWEGIQAMVDQETANGNPIAAMVASLDLKSNRVVVRLLNVFAYDEEEESEDDGGEGEGAMDGLLGDDSDDDGDDEDRDRSSKSKSKSKSKSGGKQETEPADKYQLVSVDITKSAYANARELFSDKKLAVTKERKAVDASYSAMAAVERQAEKKLAQQKQRVALQAVRRIHWFEKFHWFITTEGYLVISGRDAAQAEQIVMRYMRPGDVFVHSDAKGAFPCLVRYRSADSAAGAEPSEEGAGESAGKPGGGGGEGKSKRTISPFAIHEAANFCVCRSAAWANKVLTSAWWVWGSQIVAPRTGDYGRMGCFTHRGGKTLLPPMSMEMGFGLLFCLDDESAARHAHERRDRVADQALDELGSVMSEAASRYGLEEHAEALRPPSPPPISEEGEGEGEGATPDPTALERAPSEGKGKGKGTGKGAGGRPLVESEQEATPDGGGGGGRGKGKKVSKKKARRYAEQDEEDRDLAMAALGHGAPGTKLKDKVEGKRKEKEEEERKEKEEKSGVAQFRLEQQRNALAAVSEATRGRVERLVGRGVLVEGELAVEEMVTLSGFCEEEVDAILGLLEEGVAGAGAGGEGDRDGGKGNKSAFLAGIMRRFAKDKDRARGDKAKPVPAAAATSGEEEEEEAEAGRADLEDGTSSLTFAPRDGDTVLYALPFCGPYSSMREFKYRAKLLPGQLKKSKSVKTCMELFVRLPQCQGQEREAVEGMKDADSIAAILADTKVSVPGLQQLKQAVKAGGKKKLQRGQSNKSKGR